MHTTMYRIAEDLACAVVAVGLWEMGRWCWWEYQARRATYSQQTAFWAVVSQRFREADYCPPAEVVWGALEDFEGEDRLS